MSTLTSSFSLRGGHLEAAHFLWRAIGTAPPVNDLGFVDLVASIVRRPETRGVTDRAVDVDHAAAAATDQMVMVVANAILESRWRAGRLYATDEAFGNEHCKAVVHRLQ
jgi:hypothetical protein